jgi:predicted phosphodiesterase
MKYLIVGDFHNVRLKGKLETLIEQEKPDCLISLGDYDIIDSIIDFLEISEKYQGQVIDVPGNHDHAILNNFYIESPTLTSLNTDIDTLHTKLQEEPRAKQYLENLCQNIIKRIKIGNFNTVIVHGAYNGDIKSLGDNRDELINKLWYRLLDSNDLYSNFNEMAKLEENIMIRGHDHWQKKK